MTTIEWFVESCCTRYISDYRGHIVALATKEKPKATPVENLGKAVIAIRRLKKPERDNEDVHHKILMNIIKEQGWDTLHKSIWNDSSLFAGFMQLDIGDEDNESE